MALALSTAAPAAAQPSWSVVSTQGVGNQPLAITTIPDINQNGQDGWAVSSFLSGNATMGFSQGDGTFDIESKATGGQPVGIAAGNFNPDPNTTGFITANQSGSVTAVYGYNDAGIVYIIDATTAAIAESIPTGIGAGDFNGDGNLDAAATSPITDTVSIVIGDGDGGLTPTGTFATGDGPNSVAIDDFNGDGHLDLATGNNSALSASVLLGDGTGSFGPPISTPQRVEDAESIASGEFTGDSHRDLVVGVDSGVVMLQGDGTGQFSAPVTIASGAQGSQGMVRVADIDANGHDDVVVAFPGSTGVQALIGNGDGTFKSPIQVSAGLSDATDITTADFRGNGSLDLGILDRNLSQVKILFGQPGASLPSQVGFGPQPINATSGAQQVALTNDGAGPLSVDSVGLSGSESGDFSITSETCTGGTVARGASCQIEIDFTPSGLGPREAQLVVGDSTPAGQHLAPITGTGVDDGPTPTATTGPVTGTTPTSTSLTGTVDPRGSTTSFHFQYGASSAYGSTTAAQPAGSGNDPVQVSEPLAGLTPGQTYHYRLVATNPNGTAFGQDSVFVAAEMPVAVTGQESGVTATAAGLNGSVDPRGQATTWWFEYGAPGDGLDRATEPQTIPFGSGAVPVSAQVNELNPLSEYHFRVVALSLAGRSNGGLEQFATAALAPSAVTGAASEVGPDAARLSATINPNGLSTQYVFDYGLTTAYGNSTDPRSAGSGSADEEVSAMLTGLQPNRTYHYRVRATSDAGTASGGDHTLTTAVPPDAVTGDSDAVGVSTAVLTGSVDPRNLNTSYRFEYGETPSYGLSTPSRPAGAGLGALDVSEALGGLAPATTYHYRLVAEAADGSVAFGADRTLTTQADPSPPPPPSPVALTKAPQKRSKSRAVVGGQVGPNGQQTDWFFQYGRSKAYGRTTGTFSLPGVAGPLPVLGVLKGLKPGRRYHYRLVAVNGGGISVGRDRVLRARPNGKRR